MRHVVGQRGVAAEHAVRPADPQVPGPAHREGLDGGHLVGVVGAVAGEAERVAAGEHFFEVLLEAGVGDVEVEAEQLIELGVGPRQLLAVAGRLAVGEDLLQRLVGDAVLPADRAL